MNSSGETRPARILPAQQGFETADRAAGELHLGLVVQLELAASERAHGDLGLHALLGAVVHLAVKYCSCCVLPLWRGTCGAGIRDQGFHLLASPDKG